MTHSLKCGTVVLINGPLGIGKSTLCSQICEKVMENCASLDGDAFLECNPEPEDYIDMLHDSLIAIARLQHEKFKIDNWTMNHIWQSPYEIADLRRRLCSDTLGVRTVFSFLLQAENSTISSRIRQRKSLSTPGADWELEKAAEEVESLSQWAASGAVGEVLNASGSVESIISKLRDQILATFTSIESHSIPFLLIRSNHLDGIVSGSLNGFKCKTETPLGQSVRSGNRIACIIQSSDCDRSVAILTVTSVISLSQASATFRPGHANSDEQVLLVEFVTVHLIDAILNKANEEGSMHLTDLVVV